MNSSENPGASSALAVDALLGDGFRLLQDGETFEPGDEMLCDAIKEWLPLPIHQKTIMKWYASQFVPVRRRLPNTRDVPTPTAPAQNESKR